MKNYIKLSLIAVICFTITSCSVLRVPNLAKLSVGMDKQSAIAAIGKKPDQIIGSKKYPSGTMEVVSYYMDITHENDTAWLYFYNGKLVQFGKPAGNWIDEADIIVEESK